MGGFLSQKLSVKVSKKFWVSRNARVGNFLLTKWKYLSAANFNISNISQDCEMKLPAYILKMREWRSLLLSLVYLFTRLFDVHIFKCVCKSVYLLPVYFSCIYLNMAAYLFDSAFICLSFYPFI